MLFLEIISGLEVEIKLFDFSNPLICSMSFDKSPVLFIRVFPLLPHPIIINMATIKVDCIAYPAAPEDVFKRGEKILHEKLPALKFETSKANPEILFILTGGSEYEAKMVVDNLKYVLILAMNENNSYAAATEIKAYCNQNNIVSILINIDTEENLSRLIEYYLCSKQAISKIKKYKRENTNNSKWQTKKTAVSHY